MIELPKYISVKKGSLHYQRAIPTRLRALSKSKFYYFPLGLKQDSSKVHITQALRRASEGFRLRCQMLENFSRDSVPESELDMLFMEIIRRSSAQTLEYEYEKDLFKGPFKFSIHVRKQLADPNNNENNFNKKAKMRVPGRT